MKALHSALLSFPPGRGPPKAVLARDSVSRLPPHRSPPKPSWSLSRSLSPAPTRRSPSPNLNSLSVPADFRAGPSPSCSQGNPFKPPAGGSGPPSPVPTTHQGPVLFPDTPPFPSHPGLSPNPEPPDRSPAGLSWPLRPSPAPLSLAGGRDAVQASRLRGHLPQCSRRKGTDAWGDGVTVVKRCRCPRMTAFRQCSHVTP